MADFEVVLDKLHQFETADDIADYFRNYGIQAKRGSAMHCAISQFINIETGNVDGTVFTSPMEISLYSSDIEPPIRSTNTAAMMQFIVNYDRGFYPDLVDQETEKDYDL